MDRRKISTIQKYKIENKKQLNISLGNFRQITLYIGLGLSLYPISPLHAEWVEYFNDVSISVANNDNINVSAFSNDQESDTLINPQYSFGRYYQVDDLTRLRLELGLSAEFYDKFDDLNSVDISANSIIKHKFGIGFNKPWVRGKLSVGRKKAEVAIRDSDLYDVGLSGGKRIGERASGQIGLSYHQRNGGTGVVEVLGISSDVFDTDSLNLSVSMDYLLGERSQISANLTHRKGDFDSACTPENVGIVLANEDVKAVTVDQVFGGCAYRVNGSGNALDLQYNYAVGKYSSLNLGYEIRKGEADVLDYDSSLWKASFMYSR